MVDHLHSCQREIPPEWCRSGLSAARDEASVFVDAVFFGVFFGSVFIDMDLLCPLLHWAAKVASRGREDFSGLPAVGVDVQWLSVDTTVYQRGVRLASELRVAGYISMKRPRSVEF
ncbi:MAG: hypothetical protein R2854_31715, partial [Caldilineaceae bacterium]